MSDLIIPDDVPSPIDLRLMTDAKDWEQSAVVKRPCRIEFFSCFARQIAESPVTINRVLELGSGPGFLAKCLLESADHFNYTLLDFSAAMHSLARARLGVLASRAEFIERSFKEPGWPGGLGRFECVVTNQAVHELRHKRYAPALHAQVKTLLTPGGFYLVCDHYTGEGGMKNDQLYMSADEQRDALLAAGFNNVRQIMMKDGLVMHRASSQ